MSVDDFGDRQTGRQAGRRLGGKAGRQADRQAGTEMPRVCGKTPRFVYDANSVPLWAIIRAASGLLRLTCDPNTYFLVVITLFREHSEVPKEPEKMPGSLFRPGVERILGGGERGATRWRRCSKTREHRYHSSVSCTDISVVISRCCFKSDIWERACKMKEKYDTE